MSGYPLLDFEGPAGKLRGVNLFRSAAIMGPDGTRTVLGMRLIGAGLRSKTVLVVPSVGYVAQLFTDDDMDFHRSRELALFSLAGSTRIALRLDFLRDGDIGSAAALAEEVYDSARIHGHQDDAELGRLRQAFAAAADGAVAKSAVILLVLDHVISRTNFYLQDAAGALHSFQGSGRLWMKVLCNWIGPQLTAPDAVSLRNALLAKPP